MSVPVVESACWDTWLDVLAKDFSPSNKVGYVCHRQEQCARSSGTMVKVGQLALQVIQNRGGLAVIPDFLGADTLTTVISSCKVGSWKC